MEQPSERYGSGNLNGKDCIRANPYKFKQLKLKWFKNKLQYY